MTATEADSTANCRWCGAVARRFALCTDVNMRVSDEQFEYRRCRECGLVYVSPIPANLGSFYAESYGPHQIPSAEELSSKAEPERYKLDIVGRHDAHGRRLLDVGPGFGAFAFLAKAAGYSVQTIEMDERCAEFLRNVAGIPTVTSDRVSLAATGLGEFDVITLWHVLEHLPDAWETLQELSRHLAPGGHLVITTPNPGSIQFRLFGRHWFHLDAPRHVQLIPARALATRADVLGLDVVTMTTSDEAGRMFGSALLWLPSFLNVAKGLVGTSLASQVVPPPSGSAFDPTFLLRPDGLIRRAARKPLKAVEAAFAIAWRALIFPVAKQLERLDGLGGAYTIVLRKRALRP